MEYPRWYCLVAGVPRTETDKVGKLGTRLSERFGKNFQIKMRDSEYGNKGRKDLMILVEDDREERDITSSGIVYDVFYKEE